MDQFTVPTREELEKKAEATKKLVFSEAAIGTLKDAKFACNLEIDFGELPIGRLVGQIPMYSHDSKPSFEHLDEAEEMVKKLTREAKMWIPKERLTGENNIVRTSLICALYANPEEDPRNQFVVLIATCILVTYYLDDEMCGDVMFSTINEFDPAMEAWSQILTDVMKGKYKTFEEVPPVAATLESVVRLYWLIVKKFGNLIPPDADTESSHAKYMRQVIVRGFHSMAMMRMERVGHNCSAELYRRLRGADSAAILAIELFASLLKEGELDIKIREHIVYKQIVEVCGEEAGITNDIVGFIKEMSGNDVYYNYILRNVELEGMSFQDSFHKALKLVTDLRKDVLLLFDQLMEEFPEDNSLVEFMVLVKRMLDANIYVAAVAPRYGGLKIREVPLEE